MAIPIYQVDSFATEAFSGNPAGVCLLSEEMDAEWMQAVAAEMNVSETAFVVPCPDEAGAFSIRWFTPTVEVPLCGHATLASAAVIRAKLGHTSWPVTLHSASGPLRIDEDGDDFVLDFPANMPVPVALPAGFEKALGDKVLEAYLARDIYMVVLPDEASVARLSPDFQALALLTEHGVIATAPGDEVDFVSRFFAPSIGIDEDPVTGAAHCVMTPYWSKRLGKKNLEARQISSRIGYLQCENRGERVGLRGRAVFFLSGVISV